MKFIYGRQDFKTMERAEENCYLMTNGLGGFSSLTMAGSCTRNDHALLMSCIAAEAPNHRYNMIHRLEEILILGEKRMHLSTQDFVDPTAKETGFCFLSGFTYEDYPVWRYEAEGVEVIKTVVLAVNENTVGVSYEIINRSGKAAAFQVTPQMEFVPKGERLSEVQEFVFEKADSAGQAARGCRQAVIRSGGRSLYLETNGFLSEQPLNFRTDLYYAYDVCDGRGETGCTAANHSITFDTQPGERLIGELIYGAAPVSEHYSLAGGAGGVRRMEKSLREYRDGLRNKRSVNRRIQ